MAVHILAINFHGVYQNDHTFSLPQTHAHSLFLSPSSLSLSLRHTLFLSLSCLSHPLYYSLFLLIFESPRAQYSKARLWYDISSGYLWNGIVYLEERRFCNSTRTALLFIIYADWFCKALFLRCRYFPSITVSGVSV